MFYFPKEMLLQPVNFGCDYEDTDGNVLVAHVCDIQDKDLPCVTVPIDQYDGEDFNVNDFGHIRNDISALARASSQQEYDMMFKRLSVLSQKGQMPKDADPQQMIGRIRSRYLQSPCELESFAEQLAKIDMSKIDDVYRESLKDVKVDNSPVEQSIDDKSK
jgi:hypothetical protein